MYIILQFGCLDVCDIEMQAIFCGPVHDLGTHDVFCDIFLT